MVKEITKNISLISIGTVIFAIAINSVTIPNQLGEGGVTGLTLLLLYVFGINPAISNFVINTIIMLIGWRYLEKQTIYYTLVAIVLMSLFLQYVQLPFFLPDNSILSPIVSGFLIGTGIGIVILGRGTTAGADIIALIINKYIGLPVSSSLLLVDILVVTPLVFTIGLERGVLTFISLFLTSRTLNFIIEGFNPRKAVTVISNKYDTIADALMENIGRGITVMHGYGYYSKTEKQVLYIVINRMQLMKTQRIINDIDPNAFVTVTGIQQVIGEGFTFHLETPHPDETETLI